MQDPEKRRCFLEGGKTLPKYNGSFLPIWPVGTVGRITPTPHSRRLDEVVAGKR